MAMNSLKKVLIGKIAASNDEDVLRIIYRLLDNAQETYILSPEDISAVNEARAEYKTGNIVTDEELQKELDKWLND